MGVRGAERPGNAGSGDAARSRGLGGQSPPENFYEFKVFFMALRAVSAIEKAKATTKL